MATQTKNKWISIVGRDDKWSCTGQPVNVPRIQRIQLTSVRNTSEDPMWKSKIERGISATNSFSASKETLSYTYGKATAVVANNRVSCPTNGSQVTTEFCGVVVQKASTSKPTAVVNNARNRAAIGIRNKIRSETEAYSGLTFLGEFREVLHQIRNPAESAFAMVNHFAKKNAHAKKLRGKEFRKAVAGSWLELKFGLEPTVAEIANIAGSALQLAEERKLHRVSFVGRAESASSTRENNGSGIGQFYFDRSIISEASVRYIVGMKSQVIPEKGDLQRIVDQGGFTLPNLIPAAWELLPWSFFIDYFSNIGDCLSASLVDLSNVAWVCETERYVNKVKVSGASLVAAPNTVLPSRIPVATAYEAQYISIARTAASIPFPELRFELPSRTGQFLNMSALATLVFNL